MSTNFRTGKQVPLSHQNDGGDDERKAGQMINLDKRHSWRFAKYLEENDDEQITVNDLMNKMAEFSNREPYSARYIKEKT